MKSAYRIVAVYTVVALIWIIASDSLLSYMVSNIESLAWFSILKGIFYVAATAAMLFALIRSEIKQKTRMIEELQRTVALKDELNRELHHRIKNNLQTIISVINLETSERNFSEAAKNRIVNKLYAFSSVHDIVYDFGDFKDISLSAVLDKLVSYAGIPCDPAMVSVDRSVKFTVEELVSLALCLNELFEQIRVCALSFDLSVACAGRERIDIEITMPGAAVFPLDINEMDRYLAGNGAIARVDRGGEKLSVSIRFPSV